MRSLALDPITGDLALTSVGGGQRLALVEGADAVAQRLRARLRLWRGEWFLDGSIGIPFLQILGLKNTRTFAEATLRRAITTCPGVAGLDSFTLTVGADRAMTVAFRARATDGTAIEDNGFRVGNA